MSFFKKILKLVAIIIAIIAIAFAIYALLYYLFTSALFLGLSAWAVAGITVAGLVISAAISPDGFREATDGLVGGAKTVATTLGDAASNVVGGVVGGLLPSKKTMSLLAVGLGALFLLGGTNDKDEGNSDASTTS